MPALKSVSNTELQPAITVRNLNPARAGPNRINENFDTEDLRYRKISYIVKSLISIYDSKLWYQLSTRKNLQYRGASMSKLELELSLDIEESSFHFKFDIEASWCRRFVDIAVRQYRTSGICIVSYIWNIPGIYLSYIGKRYISGIFQVYTLMTKAIFLLVSMHVSLA